MDMNMYQVIDEQQTNVDGYEQIINQYHHQKLCLLQPVTMQLACNQLSFATILVIFETINLVLYKFSAIWLCVQLNVYNMDTCHKKNDVNLYILKLLYLIYLHKLCIIILCAFSIKVNPMLTQVNLNQPRLNKQKS